MSEEFLLFAVDLGLATVEIGFVGLDHLGLHDELVTEDANQVDRNTLKRLLACYLHMNELSDLRGIQ